MSSRTRFFAHGQGNCSFCAVASSRLIHGEQEWEVGGGLCQHEIRLCPACILLFERALIACPREDHPLEMDGQAAGQVGMEFCYGDFDEVEFQARITKLIEAKLPRLKETGL